MVSDVVARGVCACPGDVTGRLIVWEHNDTQAEIKQGDIVVIDAFNPSILSSLSRIGGVISRRHTTYSHLASLAAMLNIPCIVGAIFRNALTTGSTVCLDATNGIVTKKVRQPHSSIAWPYQIASSILRTARENNYWLHTVRLDNLDSRVMTYIKGLFLDATVFRMYSDESTDPLDRIVADARAILDLNSQLSLGYRLSTNLLSLKDIRRELINELQFLHCLVRLNKQLRVFIPLIQTKDDVVFFRCLIASEFHATSNIQIGAMIETPKAVDSLESIAENGLLDFAVVGLNDLMSLSLGLDRDDPANQDSFSMGNSFIRNTLSRVIEVCRRYQIPCLIGLPRYPTFLFDYGCLIGLGYTDFFTNQSVILNALRIVDHGPDAK